MWLLTTWAVCDQFHHLNICFCVEILGRHIHCDNIWSLRMQWPLSPSIGGLSVSHYWMGLWWVGQTTAFWVLLYWHNLVLRLLHLPSPIGSDRFCGNIADMIGYRPHVLIKYSWMYITPLTCIVSDFLIFSPNWVKCICTDIGYSICCGFNRGLWYSCAWDTPPWSSTTPMCTRGGGMG